MRRGLTDLIGAAFAECRLKVPLRKLPRLLLRLETQLRISIDGAMDI
jgi:hypothetical protein